MGHTLTTLHLQDTEDAIMAGMVCAGLYQFKLYAQFLTAEHFTDPVCRDTWRMMEELASQDREWRRGSVLESSSNVAKVFNLPLEKAVDGRRGPGLHLVLSGFHR